MELFSLHSYINIIIYKNNKEDFPKKKKQLADVFVEQNLLLFSLTSWPWPFFKNDKVEEPSANRNSPLNSNICKSVAVK